MPFCYTILEIAGFQSTDAHMPLL